MKKTIDLRDLLWQIQGYFSSETTEAQEHRDNRIIASPTRDSEVVDEGIWMEQEGQRRRVEARRYEHRIGRGE
ncbi:MAG: hypothetical protein WAW52_05075 [Methanothrix sp.]